MICRSADGSWQDGCTGSELAAVLQSGSFAAGEPGLGHEHGLKPAPNVSPSDASVTERSLARWIISA